MRNTVHSLLGEPRVPNPPLRVSRDWPLTVAAIIGVTAELIFRTDLTWPPVAFALGLGLAATLLWRRSNPRHAVAVAFGSVALADITAFIVAGKPVLLYSSAVVLILVYALFRWGSGRDVVVGFGFMCITFIVSLIVDFSGIVDSIAGWFILLFPGAIGVAIRYQRTTKSQQATQIKLEERAQLARELHDTVAHHVSAIVIQAQAGKFLAASADLAGATTALDTIEEEAARTLHEMRSMIGALRDDAVAPALAPQQGLADLDQLAELADTSVGGPSIDITLNGDLEGVLPAIEAAIYRLAQESITNAVRHARQATHVQVSVSGYDDHIGLTVLDDGLPGPKNAAGFGLVGMAERAEILGGTFEAGRMPNRGWQVSATLPRNGEPT